MLEIDGLAMVPGPNGVIEIVNAGRGDLADWLATFAKRGVEVGVAHGHYSARLMAANPSLELYGVDPYQTYSEYKDYALESTLDKLEADAHAQLDKYPTYHFVKKFSVSAAQDFEDGSLDFVYIDANHSEPFVTEDITLWHPKVRSGGVVAGHDYARVRSITDRYEVVHAVDNYTQKHGLQLYIWGLNSKADKRLIRDNIRSWMFISP